VCLLVENNLFTGDTIFSDCIGRIDLKDSSRDDMISSLEKIREINFETAYPGHYENATKQQIIKTIGFYI
jgi:glyoxylase-like metal-dependent hydrolase (beta-lactamase superfamily II)